MADMTSFTEVTNEKPIPETLHYGRDTNKILKRGRSGRERERKKQYSGNS